MSTGPIPWSISPWEITMQYGIQERNSAIRSKQMLNVKSLKWTSEKTQYNVNYNITINVISCGFCDCASNTNLEQRVLLAKKTQIISYVFSGEGKSIQLFSLVILTTPQRFYCMIPWINMPKSFVDTHFLKEFQSNGFGMISQNKTQNYPRQINDDDGNFISSTKQLTAAGEGRQIRL